MRCFCPTLPPRLGLYPRPLLRGLMFYYGLDFHDLAPDAILHISSFIIVCEAFLYVTPHFGLWLKTFNVKPRVIEGRYVECGGAGNSNRDFPPRRRRQRDPRTTRSPLPQHSPAQPGGIRISLLLACHLSIEETRRAGGRHPEMETPVAPHRNRGARKRAGKHQSEEATRRRE